MTDDSEAQLTKHIQKLRQQGEGGGLVRRRLKKRRQCCIDIANPVTERYLRSGIHIGPPNPPIRCDMLETPWKYGDKSFQMLYPVCAKHTLYMFLFGRPLQHLAPSSEDFG